MYIKVLVNTKDQHNVCMCEMTSKGSKEALTILIDTHVTHVERVERLHYVHNIDHTIQCYVCQSMLKGSKVEITFYPFDIHSIGWYGWKGLSLSFPKLFSD